MFKLLQQLPLLVLFLIPLISPAFCGLQRGLAWGIDDRWAAKDLGNLLTFYHHWADGPVDQLDNQGFEYVPMYWGTSKQADWEKRKQEIKKNKPQHVLAFNEADCPSQANMSPQAAAAAWLKELQPLAEQGIKVSTPQLCWSIDWLKEFKAACKGCDIGFIAAHWYGGKDDFAKFQTYVDNVSAVYPGHELWITEMGLTSQSGPSQQDIDAFVQKAITWMQTSGKVSRAIWTGCFAIDNPPDNFLSNLGAFFNNDGSMRSLFKWMANEQYPQGWSTEQWSQISSSSSSSSSLLQSYTKSSSSSSTKSNMHDDDEKSDSKSVGSSRLAESGGKKKTKHIGHKSQTRRPKHRHHAKGRGKGHKR